MTATGGNPTTTEGAVMADRILAHPSAEPPPLEALGEPSPVELALSDERAEALAARARRGTPTQPAPRGRSKTTEAQKHRGPILTLPKAARYAGCTKPNGTPRDSFYSAIKRELGTRRRVWTSEIDDLIERGKL
jgi:hypothetical protein